MKRKSRKIKSKKPIKTNVLSLIIGSLVVLSVLGLFSFLLTGKVRYVSPKPTPKTKNLAIKALVNPVLSKAPNNPLNLPLKNSQSLIYIVRTGDSLFKIGKTYCANNGAYFYIAEKNNLFPPYIVHVGDTLTVACP